MIAYLNPDRSVSLSVDRDYTATGYTNGISTNMNADSNVYIGMYLMSIAFTITSCQVFNYEYYDAWRMYCFNKTKYKPAILQR